MADFLVLTLDCLDLDRQSAFWCAALGYREAPGVAQYRPLVHPDGIVPKLLLQRVDDEKAGKNRLHLDIHVADPAAEAQRVEELGATRVERVEALRRCCARRRAVRRCRRREVAVDRPLSARAIRWG